MINYKFPHEGQELPVTIADADEWGVWVYIHPDPNTRLGGCILWSNIIPQNLPSMIESIKAEEAKEPQQEETP